MKITYGSELPGPLWIQMAVQYKKPFAGIQGHILNLLHTQAAEPEEKKGNILLTSTHSSIMLTSGNNTGFRLSANKTKHWAPCS